MKTWAKLMIFLIIFVFCIPARGEVLIYTKTLKCWAAGEIDEDSWDIDELRVRGYLVLDVNYADMTIVNSRQFEYWKEGRDKLLVDFEHEFNFKRIIDGRTIEWLLIEEDVTTYDTELLMLRGAARDYDIGGAGQNEVPRQLTGYRLVSRDEGEQAQICEWKLRLQSNWTSLTNDIGASFDAAVDEIERILVEEKGYGWY